MKRFLIAAIMFFSFWGLFAQDKSQFSSVDVKTFEKAIADTSFVVLDVRTAAEYAEGHIPGTDFNIDVLEEEFKSRALKLLPKDKSVALYCRSGNRSKTAAKILSDNGYKVMELSSGIRGWAAAGQKVVK